MSEATTEEVLSILNDIDYPASKDEIVGHVEMKGDENVLQAVRALPLATYSNDGEVIQSLDLRDDTRSARENAAASRENSTSRIPKETRDVEPSPLDGPTASDPQS